MTQKNGIYFDNGSVQVSRELVSTQRRYYPIRNTTARIRRDPLWLASGVTAFIVLTTIIYGDLMYFYELVVLWIIAVVSIGLGIKIAILHIDSIGHPHALVFGQAETIQKIYHAMRKAHLEAVSQRNVSIETETKEQNNISE